MKPVSIRILAVFVTASTVLPALGTTKVSGPLTLVQLDSVQRQRLGGDHEELSIEAQDAYTRKPAQLKLRRQARGQAGILDSCERYALIAMNRPDKWQLAVYLSSSNRELASFETVQRERTEWRIMKADLDNLGGQESYFRCALQRAETKTK